MSLPHAGTTPPPCSPVTAPERPTASVSGRSAAADADPFHGAELA